ncbi:MAG: LemA family protein [archaeon]|nr:LemA family protein [archaeon]MCR4323527.1 LemA family protein [Nanoarchaeota archaeon]
MVLWVIIIVVIVLAIVFFAYYNRFARLSQQIDNSLSQIGVQLKKRVDLVPNLISSVKGYMKHESAAIKTVTDARKALVSAEGIEKKMRAGNKLQSALKSIFALAENYPNLKANENFLQLQQELSSIEDKVAYARQYYNDGIMSYNIMTKTVPGMWFASIYGFKEREYLKISEAEKAVPKVEF